MLRLNQTLETFLFEDFLTYSEVHYLSIISCLNLYVHCVPFHVLLQLELKFGHPQLPPFHRTEDKLLCR